MLSNKVKNVTTKGGILEIQSNYVMFLDDYGLYKC